MRQIGSAEEATEKRKRAVQYGSIILLAILAFSTLGYSFFSNPSAGTAGSQNESVQQISDSQWTFTFGQQQIVLTTSPDVAKNITFLATPVLADFSQKSVYIDADDVVSGLIGNALIPYASRVQKACYGSCSSDLPELDCNSTLIVYRQTNESGSVSRQDSCTFIYGDKRSADAFVYKIFGMI
jgi:hypothetical protein